MNFNVAYILSIVNLLIGLVLFSLGCSIQYTYKHVWHLPIVLMCCGMLLLISSVIKWCAVWKGRFLKYLVTMDTINLIFLSMGIVLIDLFSKDILEHVLNSFMQIYSDRKYARDAWSMIQSGSCCGINGPEDWTTIFKNLTLPRSCCTEINLNKTTECILEYAHPNGCLYTKLDLVYYINSFFVAILLKNCFSLWINMRLIKSLNSTHTLSPENNNRGIMNFNILKRVAYILSIVNLLIKLVGILFLLGLFLLGCWIYYVYKYLWTLPIVLLTCGMVILLNLVIEKWAVWKGHKRFIKLFAIINVISSFSFIVGVQIFYIFAGSILKSELNSLMQKYPDQKHARDVWSMIQSESCCGIYGPKDWETIYPNLTLPRSCCTEINLNETTECIPKYAYPNGCIGSMLEFIYSFKLRVLVATLLIFCIIRCIWLFYGVIQSFKSTQRHSNPYRELLQTEERNNFINRIERNNFNKALEKALKKSKLHI